MTSSQTILATFTIATLAWAEVPPFDPKAIYDKLDTRLYEAELPAYGRRTVVRETNFESNPRITFFYPAGTSTSSLSIATPTITNDNFSPPSLTLKPSQEIRTNAPLTVGTNSSPNRVPVTD